MINLLFIIAAFLVLYVTGIIAGRMFGVSEYFLACSGIFLLPMIGLLFLITVLQTVNLIVPVLYIAPLYLLFLFWGIISFSAEIKRCLRALLRQRRFILFLLFAAIILALPVIKQTGLVSIQKSNNDIMYYLTSMDWLKLHASTEPVVYSTEHPFYWCAEYMLTRTRIGFDLFGAFVMSLSGTEAYEIFTGLGVLFVLIMMCNLNYMAERVFGIKGYPKLLLLTLILAGGSWSELLFLQYVPQILGISCLTAFIAVSMQMIAQEDETKVRLTGLLLSGTIAVYAEFAAYLLAIYAGFALVKLQKSKNMQALFLPVKAGLLGLVLNISGVIRGIKLNLFVLANARTDLVNIDPYYGEVLPFEKVLARLMGLGGSVSGAGEVRGILSFLIIESAGFLLAVLIWYLYCMEDTQKPYLAVLLLFFTGYEFYFHQINYAYGEFKHLVSAAPIVLAVLFYICSAVLQQIKYWKALAVGSAVLGSMIISFGIYGIYQQYCAQELYYFDKSLMQLQQGAGFVPQEEPVGISGDAASIHGEVYALRNRKSIILANQVSYYPFSEIPSVRYRVYENRKRVEESEKIIWNNDRFIIVENTGLQSCYYSGFHLSEETGDERWTCDQESVIVVMNYAESDKQVSLSFMAYGINAKNIKVMYQGKILAAGKTGEQIITEPIMIKAGERVDFYLYSDQPLDEYHAKTVGFQLKNYMLLDY